MFAEVKVAREHGSYESRSRTQTMGSIGGSDVRKLGTSIFETLAMPFSKFGTYP